MVKQYESKKEQSNQEMKRDSEIVKTDTWMNRTRARKGFIIRFKDDFKKGDIVIGSIKNLEEFLDEEKTGVPLSKLVPLEE